MSFQTREVCAKGHRYEEVGVVVPKDGRRRCRECYLQAKRRRYNANKEKRRADANALYNRNLERNRKLAKARSRAQRASRGQEINLQRRCHSKGITVPKYLEILREQVEGCGICGADADGRHGAFVIDHDHSTGKVRGILCNSCNLLLGLAKDNRNILLSAARYLLEPRRLLKLE